LFYKQSSAIIKLIRGKFLAALPLMNNQLIGEITMRTLHPGEFNKVAGGRGLKDFFKKAEHQVKREGTRISGQIQREFDRHVKNSHERMGGDTTDLDMDKARDIDRQKIQEYRDQEVQ
jgi:hypothetical protein